MGEILGGICVSEAVILGGEEGLRDENLPTPFVPSGHCTNPQTL